MQLEKELPKKVIQIINSIPETTPLNQSDFLIEALTVFSQNPIFRKALNSIHNIKDCSYTYIDKNNGRLDFVIRLSQIEGRFDADLGIGIHNVGTELCSLELNIICADEILYNLPINTVEEVYKIRYLKPEEYKPPKGAKIIFTPYLDRLFFAFLKNCYFMANYSPLEKAPVNITQIISYDSAKASKSYPEYLPNPADAKRLKVKQHCGGTQLRTVKWNSDLKGNVLDKEISLDTYFRVLREFRAYKITPQTRGCIIERTEEGKTSGNAHRSSSKRKVTKKVNIPFERLKDLGMIFNEFEKRCMYTEKSKLVAPKVPESYISEKQRLKREDIELLGKKRSFESSKEQIEHGRRPADPSSQKIKFNYLQNQKLKELKHDESIKYRRSRGQVIDLVEEVLNNYPELQEDIVTSTIIQPESQYAMTMTSK